MTPRKKDAYTYQRDCQVSLLFRRELGIYYDPVMCWTSRLRSRAGLPEFPNKTHHASFTMSDPEIAKKVTELLYKRGWNSLAQYHQEPPTYHFDVGVSVGGLDDTFEWGTSQLQMVRKWHFRIYLRCLTLQAGARLSSCEPIFLETVPSESCVRLDQNHRCIHRAEVQSHSGPLVTFQFGNATPTSRSHPASIFAIGESTD